MSGLAKILAAMRALAIVLALSALSCGCVADSRGHRAGWDAARWGQRYGQGGRRQGEGGDCGRHQNPGMEIYRILTGSGHHESGHGGAGR